MISSSSTLEVDASAHIQPKHFLNPNKYVTFDEGRSCRFRPLFPQFSEMTNHAPRVTIAKRLSKIRARALASTDNPLLQFKAKRMESCGQFVAVRGNGSVIATRCHRRGCPLCDSHKSWKTGSVLRRILDRTKMNDLQGYLMTSSTGENCTADELRDECKLIALAFRKFLGYALVKKHSNIIGASRGTEVTYSPATGYNPHTHVILWTRGQLSIKGNTDQARISLQLQRLWNRAVKRSRKDQVIFDLEKIKPTVQGDKTDTDAYVRVMRYITKAFKMDLRSTTCDEMILPDHAQVTLATALRGLRLCSHSGWIREELSIQKRIDKEAVEYLRKKERVTDTSFFKNQDLTHFVWNDSMDHYRFRDELTAKCLYERSGSYLGNCSGGLSDDRVSIDYDKSLITPRLEYEQRQLFIYKNKDVETIEVTDAI